jgi:hypothetical protein
MLLWTANADGILLLVSRPAQPASLDLPLHPHQSLRFSVLQLRSAQPHSASQSQLSNLGSTSAHLWTPALRLLQPRRLLFQFLPIQLQFTFWSQRSCLVWIFTCHETLTLELLRFDIGHYGHFVIRTLVLTLAYFYSSSEHFRSLLRFMQSSSEGFRPLRRLQPLCLTQELSILVVARHHSVLFPFGPPPHPRTSDLLGFSPNPFPGSVSDILAITPSEPCAQSV